eukprot:scaffold13369_cov298-Alexandrium_tamarense.AAC.3
MERSAALLRCPWSTTSIVQAIDDGEGKGCCGACEEWSCVWRWRTILSLGMRLTSVSRRQPQ